MLARDAVDYPTRRIVLLRLMGEPFCNQIQISKAIA